jgi:hypothetical protein
MIEGVTKNILSRVADAARAFEARWTTRRLKQIDPKLHARLQRQQELFQTALVTCDDDEELVAQGEAMIRGWAAATARMEGQEDCSYLIGRDERSGLQVAISCQQSASDRVAEVHGVSTVFLTPDECATLLAAQREVLQIKNAFPGCEVVDLHPGERRSEDVA